ncbi:hypothetical protein HDU83_003907 [Entophlyctis luteolus]|nr:hypothetical protein HDU83_003907 [Entophlyctis luteolus]
MDYADGRYPIGTGYYGFHPIYNYPEICPFLSIIEGTVCLPVSSTVTATCGNGVVDEGAQQLHARLLVRRRHVAALLRGNVVWLENLDSPGRYCLWNWREDYQCHHYYQVDHCAVHNKAKSVHDFKDYVVCSGANIGRHENDDNNFRCVLVHKTTILSSTSVSTTRSSSTTTSVNASASSPKAATTTAPTTTAAVHGNCKVGPGKSCDPLGPCCNPGCTFSSASTVCGKQCVAMAHARAFSATGTPT